MKKITLEIELEFDSEMMYGDSLESMSWFIDSVLTSPADGEELVLHSNCIGDSIGEIKACRIIGGEM
jgi:hypothetical protein